MNKEVREIFIMRRKLVVPEYARHIGSVTKACQEFEVARSSFYEWKKVSDSELPMGIEETKAFLNQVCHQSIYQLCD